MWHFFLFFFHFVVVKTSSRQLYSVLAGTLTTPFLFLCVFWGISPNRRTLGRYVKGALPILYVLMFPWKYFFSISIGKKWGNEKRVVYVRGVTCPSRWTLRCGDSPSWGPSSNHHRAAFAAISIMSLSVGLGLIPNLTNSQSRIGANEWRFGEGGLRCWPQRTKSSN